MAKNLSKTHNRFRSIFASICMSVVALLTAAQGSDAQEVYTLADGRVVAPLDVFRDCDVCPEMIALPLGTFRMGSVPGDALNRFDVYRPNVTVRREYESDEISENWYEYPQHDVEIDVPFAIGVNEVTFGEWTACVEDGGCSHIPDNEVFKLQMENAFLGPMHPVMNVSYLDIQEYIDWLNSKMGSDVYRLPTEVEWEYAARAGTTTRFSQGDLITTDQANFSPRATSSGTHVDASNMVERFQPLEVTDLDAANPWGIRHMSGNVSEVTESCGGGQHLGLPSSSAYLEISASQTTCWRVLRGGTFGGSIDNIRVARRENVREIRRRVRIGFRLIRN